MISQWLERRPAVLAALCSAIYFAAVLPLAARRLLWNDELFTLYIGSQPTFADTWSALKTGAEQMPPLFYVITRGFLALPGRREIVLRLPEILGFWGFGLLLFVIVRRRTSAMAGAAAMGCALVSGAFQYAYEARPYALVLCFAALALWFWMGGRAAAMCAALAAAIWCHYYGVLAAGALAAGEAALWFETRRLRGRVWAALAAAPASLALILPLLQSARAYSGHFWSKPGWRQIPATYEYFLGPAIMALVCVGAVIAFARPGKNLKPVPAHERVLALALAALPVIAVAAAKAVTGAFTFRYVIVAVIGFCVLLGWGLFAALGGRMLLAVCALYAVFAAESLLNFRSVSENAASRREAIAGLAARAPAGLPLVMASPHLMFEYWHYGPPELKRRMLYLADPELALRHAGTDSVDRSAAVLARYAGYELQDFRSWIAAHPRFALAGYPGSFAWLVQALNAMGARIAILGMDGERTIYVVTVSGASS